MSRACTSAAAIIGIFVAACSGGDSGEPGIDASPGSDGGALSCSGPAAAAESDFTPPAIHFDLLINDRGATFVGEARDSAPLEFHIEEERQAGCRLLSYTPSSCQPECTSGQLCLDSTCETHPGALNMGVLRLSGLDEEPVVVAPVFEGQYSWQTEELIIPGGTTVQLAVEGNEGPALSLAGCAPATPIPTANWDQALEERSAGQDVTFAWSNPETSARIYLRMTTGVGELGGISPIEIECEGPDMGTLTLPGPYLDELFAAGWDCEDCGVHELYRWQVAEASEGETTALFRAGSSVRFVGLP